MQNLNFLYIFEGFWDGIIESPAPYVQATLVSDKTLGRPKKPYEAKKRTGQWLEVREVKKHWPPGSARVLLKAAQDACKLIGEEDAVKIIKPIAKNPQNATKMLMDMKTGENYDVVELTDVEALAFMTKNNFTVDQYKVSITLK